MQKRVLPSLGAFAAFLAATSALTSAEAALTVSTAPTVNVSCASGVCTSTAADAVMNAKSLMNLLRKGDLSLVADNAAKDIVFAAPVHWASAHALNLSAARNIVVNRAIQVTGEGGLTMQGGPGGFLSFAWNGYVNFMSLSSHLSIAGHDYTLVSSLPSLISAVNGNPLGYFALANNYDATVDGTYTSSPMPLTLGGALEGWATRSTTSRWMRRGSATRSASSTSSASVPWSTMCASPMSSIPRATPTG